MRFRLLGAFIDFATTVGGCMEPPLSAYFLKNSTREVLRVYSRDKFRPEYRESWEVKPGESDVLALYRFTPVKNFAQDQGFELRLQWAECTTDVSNKSLRERTQTESETKWVLDVVPEMLY